MILGGTKTHTKKNMDGLCSKSHADHASGVGWGWGVPTMIFPGLIWPRAGPEAQRLQGKVTHYDHSTGAFGGTVEDI